MAGVFGRILKDLGLLSKGELKLHKSSEFIGSVIGASEESTRKIIKRYMYEFIISGLTYIVLRVAC